jgi:uroporphyrinogen decarboxylase
MTSRERVRAVINHQIPDSVPNGLGGCETAGLHVLTYDRLQNVLGVEKTPPRLDTFMVNAAFEEDVIKAMKGDIILLASPQMCKSDLRGDGWEKQWKTQDLWGKKFRVSVKDNFDVKDDGSVVWTTSNNVVCPPGAFFFDSLGSTDLFAEVDIPSPDIWNPPHDMQDNVLRSLENAAKHLNEETDLSICLGETITDLQIQPGGMVGSMILMKEEPDVMGEFLQKSVDAGLAQLKLLDQAVGKYVDILSIAQDFGDNRCVTIGAGLWREIYKPYYKQLFQGWKKITKMKSNLHSCGAVSSILGDLIECGVEIFNPVQTSANEMSPASLKERFGDNMVFWGGGYDAQMFQQTDSYDTVYQKVLETVNTFKIGGGYIFAGVHNLPADICETHLKAMLDAWNDAKMY